jgi:hypothetical protein
MPWHLKTEGDQVLVVRDRDQKVVGRHANRKKATAQLRVLYSLEKAQFQALIEKGRFASRSEAGRYAANMRWQGNTKTEVKAPLSPTASDITEELKTYFGKNVEQYLKSEGYKEIRQRRVDKEKQNTGVGDIQLEVVAKKQGFDGKPTVVTEEQMGQLEKEGWTIAYRGIQDIEQEGDLGDLKAEELAEQFRTGEYFAGFGTSGNGIYFAKDEAVAQQYAGLKGGKSLVGTVIKVAIPPGVLMSEEDFKYELSELRDLQKGTYYDGEWYGDDDIGRKIAAKGVRGVQVGLVVGDSFIIYDRSMLAVEESTKTK